jgi:hypothetical protein
MEEKNQLNETLLAQLFKSIPNKTLLKTAEEYSKLLCENQRIKT